MPVEIHELEVAPAPGQQGGAQGAPPPQQPPGAPRPELERQLERAASLRHERDLRLKAD